jgi:hypothetical protein
MLLSQNRHWRVTRARGGDEIVLALLRDGLPDEWRELRDFRLEIPVERWNRVVKHVRTDRKLLGGIVLDFANQEDQLAAVLGHDRLYGDLQRVVQDATSALVESGVLALTAIDLGPE